MRLGDLIALRRSRISLSLGVVSRPAHAGGAGSFAVKGSLTLLYGRETRAALLVLQVFGPGY